MYHWWCILLTRHNTTDYCNYKWCMSYIIRSQPSSRDAPKNQAELAVTSARPAKFKVPRQPTVGGVASKVMLWICLKMECPNFDTVEWENDENMMRKWWNFGVHVIFRHFQTHLQISVWDGAAALLLTNGFLDPPAFGFSGVAQVGRESIVSLRLGLRMTVKFSAQLLCWKGTLCVTMVPGSSCGLCER